MPDCKEVAVHLGHPADAVVLDNFGSRFRYPQAQPGSGLKGLKALPGWTLFRQVVAQSLLKRFPLPT
jgi:hypothetical protein